MTALQRLDEYLRRLELRLRLIAAARGAAIAIAAALLLTLVLVWISNQLRFAGDVILPMRLLLFASVAAAIVGALAIPVSRVNRRRVIRLSESRVAEFKQRLITATEKRDPGNPFTELVAEDALRIAEQHQPGEFVPARRFWEFGTAAVLAAGVLLWLITAGPGYWRYGAALLWTGTSHAGSKPLYEIVVQPGNKTIRRKSDQPVTAQLVGFSQGQVTLHAKYRGSLKWDAIAMQPQPDGNGYQFLFAGLSDALDYYVEAGGTKSKHYVLNVKDLPLVKRVRVGLHFPSGIGLQDVVQDPGGDIRAVIGSGADIAVLTDRKLDRGQLVMDDGKTIDLKPGDGNWLTAHLSVKRDGSYHIAAIDDGEAVRISDDYFIEAKKDEPPTVKISRPGRDPRVSPIEELPVTVESADDYGVKNLELHYSVNGGPEQVTSLLKSTGTKEAERKSTLFLEDMKLAPGDVVSLWATARDAGNSSTSDILFVHAEPFDYKFRQSQQSGGGGGSGSDENARISERQKEIIAATWNQLRDAKKEQQSIAENARFLSEMQGKLGEQAKALAERMGSRELVASSPQFAEFSKSMNEASARMGDAVQQLKPGDFKDALPPEEKALQSLLHAESVFRDIQVAFGNNAGGGSGSSGADQDLARMFDLELDTAKNQYETGQKATPPGGDQQQQIDEALQRLKDLARRQQQLADQQHNPQQNFQQRWEEEQLRREAEQLRQQMQQLARNGQQGSQSSSAQQQQQQGRQSGSQQSQASQGGSQRGQQSASGSSQPAMQQAMQQAMENLQRAEDEMRKAVSDHDAGAQQRAAQQLAQAQKSISDMLGQQAGSSVADLARKAQELAEDQKDLARRIKQQYGAEGIDTARDLRYRNPSGSVGGVDMPEMLGPGFTRYNWRRKAMPEDFSRPATGEEKALAGENEKLSQKLQQLERDMQQQSQGMRDQQPDAARKLSKALSDAEQEELALRMQKSSEWMRRGFGGQNWPMEDSITAGMDELNRQLQEVQQAVANDKNGDGKEPSDKMAQTLAQIRSLRQQLENRSQANSQGNSQGGQSSQGSRQGQSSQGSQQGPSSQGSQNGQQSQGSANGQAGSDGTQTARGQWSQYGGGRLSLGGGKDVQDTIAELSALRGQIGRNDRRFAGEVNDAIGRLQQIKGQDGLLDARVNQDTVASLERLEVELNRRLGQDSGATRTGTPEVAPEQYRDAVAEYFKRLSK